MTRGTALPPRDANEEVSALIETLHETERRLEELTAGEVDTVAAHDGRTLLLRRAQEQWRHSEAAKQAAIVNALPAHIALLDPRGEIISVNEAWRRFASANALPLPEDAIGVNYLNTCDLARGDHSSEAREVALGIRAVLGGGAPSYSIEYPCHSPTEQRWFVMTVTPLAADRRNGAVVMHLDVTAERKAEESLRVSEARFRQMAENIKDVFFLLKLDGSRMYYVSPAYEDIWGRTCDSLYAAPGSWAESIHPADQAEAYAKYEAGRTVGFDYEYRIVRPGGDVRWVHVRGFPILNDAGVPYRMAGVASDVTQRKQAAQELIESERRFSDVLRNVELVSLMLDRDAMITYCNDYLLRLTGWRHEDVIGRNWFDLFIPPDLGDLSTVFARLIGNEPDALHHENEILTRSGERRLIRWNNLVLRSGDGDVIGTASVGEDITEQKWAEVRIKRLNRLYAVLSGINMLIVRARDRDDLFREACRIAVEAGAFKMAWVGVVDPLTLDGKVVAWYGGEEEYVDGIKLTAREGTPESERPASRALRESRPVICNDIATDSALIFRREEVLRRGHKSVAYLPLTVTGRPEAVIALISGESNVFDDEEMRLLRELAGDISFAMNHIEQDQKLKYLAYYDALTGLANRSLFLERVSQYVRGAASGGHELAVYVIDLERFKNINDSLGQAAGDAVLRQVGEWLTQAAGDVNLLARVGPDHFAAVLPVIKEGGDVVRLLEKTIEAFLDHPFRLDDAVFRIAAKVGVAMFPNDGADADTLFRNAEAALKKAKKRGERYLFYTQKMTETVAGKVTLENQMREAIAREEFVLHYQPKVNLGSGKVTSAEALIRWNDPRTGLVPPGRFIPILEETGLILEVGKWALRTAVADYLRWRDESRPAVRIAVNVSPLQLRNRGFVAEIEQMIGIDARAAAGLELEITESVIMEDVKHNIACVQEIRALGVCIAIDDFGTGFSSLSYLSKLPVDTLKIDRSFVIDMTSGPQGLALVSTIINLAHSLKLKVVAEGVETDEQSRLLRLLNCDEIQGFLFSKPVPTDIFEAQYLAPI